MRNKFIQLLLLVVSLTLSGSHSLPVRAVEVRVLSFNMHHGEDKWGYSNLREVTKIIRGQKPHVVALQAVDSVVQSGVVNFQLRRLAIQTGMYHLYVPSDSVTGGSHGVGLLSVWPFENSQQIPLPRSYGADPRVMACGLISPSRGMNIRVCTARLEYASVFDRALQSAYVNQILAQSIQPVVLALDMGARPNEQPYFSYRKSWIDAARGSYLPTWTEGISGDRLDYLMVLKNTRVRVKSYTVLRNYPDASDHFPISATFEFW